MTARVGAGAGLGDRRRADYEVCVSHAVYLASVLPPPYLAYVAGGGFSGG